MKAKNTYFILVLCLTALVTLLSSFSDNRNNQNVDTNAKMKSYFIYGFTKNIEWPQGYKEGNFIIGILGNSNLSSELNTMASTYKAGNQSFEIKKFSSTASIEKCHMLIIAPDQPGDFQEILSKIRNSSTLLITEKAGLAKQGSIINFVVQNNKQGFELNRSIAEKYDLKVSSSLSTLAVNVY